MLQEFMVRRKHSLSIMQNTKTFHEQKKQEDKLATRFDTNHDTNGYCDKDCQKPINFRSSFSVLNFGTCPI